MGGVVTGLLVAIAVSFKYHINCLMLSLTNIFISDINYLTLAIMKTGSRNCFGGGVEVQQGGTVVNEGRNVRSKYITFLSVICTVISQVFFRYVKYVGTLFLSMLKCIIIPLVIYQPFFYSYFSGTYQLRTI